MKTVILLFALVQPLLFAAGQTHPCSSDVTNDGHVDVHDLLSMFAEFGSVGSYGTDTNDDGMVNVNDLLDILSSYGTKCDVLQEMYQCSELKPLFHENIMTSNKTLDEKNSQLLKKNMQNTQIQMDHASMKLLNQTFIKLFQHGQVSL